MGAASSTMTSYDRLARSFRSFSNTSSLSALHAPSASTAIAGENGPRSSEPLEIQLVHPPNSATDDHNTEEDNYYKRIVELLQPRSLTIALISCSFLVYPPTSSPNILALSKIYRLFLLLAFVASTCSWYFMDRAKPTQGHVWLLQQAMKIATTSFVVAVILRIFMGLLQSNPFVWYEVVVPVLAVAGISLYLWRGWVKLNSLEQAASAIPASTSADTAGEV